MKVLLATVALTAVMVLVIDLAGGFAHPLYFGGLAVAAGSFLALLVVAAPAVQSYDWPRRPVVQATNPLATLERVRVIEYRMGNTDPAARAAGIDPILTDIVADLLIAKYQVDLERQPDQARALLSAELAAAVGLDRGAKRALDRAGLRRLTEEIEQL
jgi:hypothetical protein